MTYVVCLQLWTLFPGGVVLLVNATLFLFITYSNLVFAGLSVVFTHLFFVCRNQVGILKNILACLKTCQRGRLKDPYWHDFLNRIFFLLKPNSCSKCGVLLQIFMERFSQIISINIGFFLAGQSSLLVHQAHFRIP